MSEIEPPALPIPWLPEAAARRCLDELARQTQAIAATMFRPSIRSLPGDRLELVDLGPPVFDPSKPIVDRLDRLRALASGPAYVVEIGPAGVVRAYRLDEHRKAEPLEAVMDLDDDTADRRQLEAREAAIARLWSRERWGR